MRCPLAIIAATLFGSGYAGLGNEDDLTGPPPPFVTLFDGNGDGIFTPENFSILQDAFQTNMSVADFNGDGELDIAMTDPTYAEETILLQAPPLGNGPDFSIAPAGDTSVSVAPGTAASYPIKVTSLNGFTGVVNYSVSDCPANATCSFSTYNFTTISETSDFYVDTVWSLFRLNVQTAAPAMVSAAVRPPTNGWPPGLPPLLLGVTFGLSLVSARRGWHKHSSYLPVGPLALLLLYFVMSSMACGGGSTPKTVGGSPVGTYNLVVTSTSGSISHSTALTLTVR